MGRTILQIIANQIAIGIDHFEKEDDEITSAVAHQEVCPGIAATPRSRPLTFHKNDDCVFLDEYLVRNVPGRILWLVLAAP
jgi:adenylate cyclase